MKRKRGGPSRRDPAGRTHLLVVRDGPESGEQLALREDVFREAWQNELVVGAATTVRALIGDEPAAESVVGLARSVMDAVSRLTAGLLARAPDGAVACRAGCDHCCYQAVSLTLPEALAIVERLRATLTADGLAALTA